MKSGMIGAENEHTLKRPFVKTDKGSTKLTILPIGIVSIRLLVGVNIGWSRSKIYGINLDKKAYCMLERPIHVYALFRDSCQH